MLIGYMRVSMSEKSLDLQSDALERAGCERRCEDVCSGAVRERPGLACALDHARDGDTVMDWKLDRIGRSLQHVVQLVADLRERGIGLDVLTGGADTTGSAGRLVFDIFTTLAEFERDLTRERTMVGLASARAHGRSGGRPRMMTRPKLKTAMMVDQENRARDVAEQLGLSVSTLYTYVDGEWQPKPRAVDLLQSPALKSRARELVSISA